MAESIDEKTNTSTSFQSLPTKTLDDDDLEGNDDVYIPYGKRPEWSDVTPLKQTAVPHRVIQIDYTPRFLDVFDYFRAVMASGEKSSRVLDLTTDAIELNAANYTVWQYRRDVLQALRIPQIITKSGLSSDFQKEFNFSLESIDQNEKNYQVWHHRKILTQWAAGYNEDTDTVQLSCPEAKDLLAKQELDLTCKLLEKDAKNYHTWQYRQWLLNCLRCFEGELTFVDNLITEDVRNNSAWNQRHFVIKSMDNVTPEVVHDEIKYTWDKIKQAPSNESPWSYLAGLFRLIPEVTLVNTPHVLDICERFFDSQSANPSTFLLSFLLSIYDKLLEVSDEDKDRIYQRALEVCDILITADTIRSTYWNYKKDKFQSKFGPDAATNLGS